MSDNIKPSKGCANKKKASALRSKRTPINVAGDSANSTRKRKKCEEFALAGIESEVMTVLGDQDGENKAAIAEAKPAAQTTDGYNELIDETQRTAVVGGDNDGFKEEKKQTTQEIPESEGIKNRPEHKTDANTPLNYTTKEEENKLKEIQHLAYTITTADKCVYWAERSVKFRKQLLLSMGSWIKFDNPLLVTPLKLQEGRFDNIKILYTEATEHLYETIVKLDTLKNNRKIVILGPIGFGKSSALLVVVMLLRQRENCRVIYVNNPETLFASPIERFLFEIIYAFAEDGYKITGPKGEVYKTTKELWENWYNHCDEKGFDGIRNLMRTIVTYCQKNGIRLFYVVGQGNYMYNADQKENMGRKIHDLISTTIYRNIICSSHNNSLTDLKAEEANKIGYYDCFTDEEARKYISNILDSETDYIEDMTEIKAATNLIPLELRELCKYLIENSVDVAMQEYLRARSKHFYEKHMKFLQNLCKAVYSSDIKKCREDLVPIMSKIGTGEEICIANFNIDKRLLITRNEYSLKCILEPICQAATEALLNIYKEEPKFKTELKSIIGKESIRVSATEKGCQFERKCINCLAKAITTQAQTDVKLTASTDGSKIVNIKQGDMVLLKEVRKESGSYIITLSKDAHAKNRLYEFKGSFPAGDALYLSKEDHLAVVFQMATNVRGHLPSDQTFLTSILCRDLYAFAKKEGWSNFKIYFCWVGNSRSEEGLPDAFNNKIWNMKKENLLQEKKGADEKFAALKKSEQERQAHPKIFEQCSRRRDVIPKIIQALEEHVGTYEVCLIDTKENGELFEDYQIFTILT
eukprot:TRINITY_DN122042_c0_g1_i1.p1 TRINITY_DN122042_c0_g1~~TRINITY_DN122042_c0_g1_i1.p1  ORF type:complete len:811 (+),score=82.55 TRINITY_DN122042_c0_g1_i1:115-2547(+)